MLIEEEPKSGGDINTDALEAVFEEDVLLEEEVVFAKTNEDNEDADEIDIAFAANDEGYW